LVDFHKGYAGDFAPTPTTAQGTQQYQRPAGPNTARPSSTGCGTFLSIRPKEKEEVKEIENLYNFGVNTLNSS